MTARATRTYRTRSRVAALAATGLVATSLVACAPQPEGSPGPATTACGKDTLATKVAGKLTIATDDPGYEPWVVDNKPENKQGFESAVASAVATKLGYSDAEVAWVRVTFNTAIAPGPKNFDFDINQFSITDERKQAVDFSAPYYDVRQAVVTTAGSPIAGATSLAALRGAKLGAQVGTTSYQAITDIIKPTTAPQVFNTNDDVVAQLKNGTIDGAVVDLPTAFYITAAELDNGVIVGQLPQPTTGTPEQFGLVLDKGSAITGCVSQAVTALRADGTLKQLETQWLAQVAGAPELS